MSRFARPATGVVIVLLLVAAALVALQGDDKKHLTAYFPTTISLYPGAQVKVLGVRVGTVDDVAVEGTKVRVAMTYDAEENLPADVHAVIVPPSLLGDRFVQLTPAYTGGAALPEAATLNTDRTSVPLEVDETYRSLDQLAKALGPKGANKSGALSRLVSATADNLKGNGAAFNSTMRELSDAVATLEQSSPDIAGTVTNLASVTKNLAGNDGQLRTMVTTLTSVSTELNGQRSDLRGAVRGLDTALAELGGFVRKHRPELARTIGSLTKTTGTIAKHREDLAEVLDIAPLAVNNLAHTNQPLNWDPEAPGAVAPSARTGAVTARGHFLNDLDSQLGHTMTALCGQLPAEHQRQLAPLCTALRQAGGDLGQVLTQAATEEHSGPSADLGELLLGGPR